MIGERQQPFVVGGDDHDATRCRELAQQSQHAVDLDVVEVRGGLVGQHERRIVRERTGDGHALLLPARHVGGPVRRALGELHPLEQRVRPLLGLLAGHLPGLQRDLHVLARGEARDEVERLEHDADGVAAVARELAARRGR